MVDLNDCTSFDSAEITEVLLRLVKTNQIHFRPTPSGEPSMGHVSDSLRDLHVLRCALGGDIMENNVHSNGMGNKFWGVKGDKAGEAAKFLWPLYVANRKGALPFLSRIMGASSGSHPNT